MARKGRNRKVCYGLTVNLEAGCGISISTSVAPTYTQGWLEQVVFEEVQEEMIW